MASKLTIIFCSGYEYFESLAKILFIYVCPSNQLVSVVMNSGACILVI